ncbi:MAG: flagellin [Acetobacteraceae bacterium]|nr:flagellin [Acetobacteraceae bacterium]
MPLNSVNTNIGAMVALQSLNKTNDDMALTQKRISTGMRVADAKDDGAAFAVAQSVRADVAALTSANEQLGASQGLLDTTNAALKKVSDTMTNVRTVLTKLAEDGLTTEQRTQYNAQYTALRSQIQSFVNDASYNGKSLLGAAPGGADDRQIVHNEKADQITLASTDKATLVVAAAPADAAAALAALGAADRPRGPGEDLGLHLFGRQAVTVRGGASGGAAGGGHRHAAEASSATGTPRGSAGGEADRRDRADSGRPPAGPPRAVNGTG